MLNCSTCHKKKPEAHFYAYPDHKPHIPSSPTPADSETLARLLADGIVSQTAAHQTPTASRATLASARQQLATSGRPQESEAQRRRREAAQARAVEREEEDARWAEEEEEAANEPLPWWMKAGMWAGGVLFAGALVLAGYQQAHTPGYGPSYGATPGDFPTP